MQPRALRIVVLHEIQTGHLPAAIGQVADIQLWRVDRELFQALAQYRAGRDRRNHLGQMQSLAVLTVENFHVSKMDRRKEPIGFPLHSANPHRHP